jgi:hypothetical protein
VTARDPRDPITPRYIYVSTAVLLVLAGLVTILSIGFPILVLGVTLLALTPVRTRPTIFRPALAGVLGFLIGLILVAPLGCTTSSTALPGSAVQTGSTTCTSILGPEYSGSATYDPSYVPALLAGLILGAVAWLVVRTIVVRRRPSVST